MDKVPTRSTSTFSINSNNNCSLKLLQSKTSQAKIVHQCSKNGDSSLDNVNKKGSCQETPNNASSSNDKMCSYVELIGRRKIQKYAWLGDDEEEEGNVSSFQKLIVSNSSTTGEDGYNRDRIDPANASIKGGTAHLS